MVPIGRENECDLPANKATGTKKTAPHIWFIDDIIITQACNDVLSMQNENGSTLNHCDNQQQTFLGDTMFAYGTTYCGEGLQTAVIVYASIAIVDVDWECPNENKFFWRIVRSFSCSVLRWLSATTIHSHTSYYSRYDMVSRYSTSFTIDRRELTNERVMGTMVLHNGSRWRISLDLGLGLIYLGLLGEHCRLYLSVSLKGSQKKIIVCSHSGTKIRRNRSKRMIFENHSFGRFLQIQILHTC